eukprot:3587882-Amphidinium_carterae.1
MVLWSEDSEVPKARQGLRLYRSLQGKAATMAELMTDDTIRGEGGFQRILTFFDDMYTQHLRLAYDQDFDRALYSGARLTQETCLQYAIRKRTELTNFELHHEAIGEFIKGKVLLRHARLDTAQTQRVHTWIKGDRNFTTVFEAITRLDTEFDTPPSTKAFWQHEEEYPEPVEEYDSWYAPAETWEDSWQETEDYTAALYAERNDEGEDSDAEDVYWMHPDTLTQPFDEYTLDQTFATFAEVKKQKAALRTNRGYYSSPSSKGKGFKSTKGKGKGKGKGKDRERQTRWRRRRVLDFAVAASMAA